MYTHCETDFFENSYSTMKTHLMQNHTLTKKRKAYRKPVLLSYGKVDRMTRSNKGSVDDDLGGTLKP